METPSLCTRSPEPERPHHINRCMSDDGGEYLPLGPPCPPVEDSRDGCQQHISPIERGAMVEMREAEQHRCCEKRASTAQSGFQQVLKDCAKEEFFRECNYQESENSAGQHRAQLWDYGMKMNEVRNFTQSQRDRKIEQPFAKSDAECRFGRYERIA
jgi:hypothetical protein